MKAACILLAIFCALTPKSFAQTGKEAAIEYNKLINKAELKVCDSDFVEANKYYSKAFAINKDKPFSMDLFTAFHCAMDVDDYNTAENYLKILLNRGVNPMLFDMSFLDHYTGEKRDVVDNLIKKYPNNKDRNDSLNILMQNLYKRDQDVRQYFASIIPSGAYMTDSVYKVDADNAAQLLQIIRESGHIPNENEVRNMEDVPWAGPYMNVIIGHYIQNYYQNKAAMVFDTLLYNAILNFDSDVLNFAVMLSRSNHQDGTFYFFDYNGTKIAFPICIPAWYAVDDNGKPYFQKMSAEEENRINGEREKLGLSTLQEARKKLNFQYLQRLNKGKYFINHGDVANFMDANAQQIQKALDNGEIYEFKP